MLITNSVNLVCDQDRDEQGIFDHDFCLAGDPADVRWPRGLCRLRLRARAPARRSMLRVSFFQIFIVYFCLFIEQCLVVIECYFIVYVLSISVSCCNQLKREKICHHSWRIIIAPQVLQGQPVRAHPTRRSDVAARLQLRNFRTFCIILMIFSSTNCGKKGPCAASRCAFHERLNSSTKLAYVVVLGLVLDWKEQVTIVQYIPGNAAQRAPRAVHARAPSVFRPVVRTGGGEGVQAGWVTNQWWARPFNAIFSGVQKWKSIFFGGTGWPRTL